MSNVGFIGLGIMGKPMAAQLQTAGHKLFLHDVASLPKNLLDGGAVGCKSGLITGSGLATSSISKYSAAMNSPP